MFSIHSNVEFRKGVLLMVRLIDNSFSILINDSTSRQNASCDEQLIKFCPTPTCVSYCILSAFRVCEKKSQGDWGGIQTHVPSADVLTSQPPKKIT